MSNQNNNLNPIDVNETKAENDSSMKKGRARVVRPVLSTPEVDPAMTTPIPDTNLSKLVSSAQKRSTTPGTTRRSATKTPTLRSSRTTPSAIETPTTPSSATPSAQSNRRLEIMLQREMKQQKEELQYTYKPNIATTQKKYKQINADAQGSRFDKLYADAAKRHLDSKWKETVQVEQEKSPTTHQTPAAVANPEELYRRLHSYTPDLTRPETVKAEMEAELTFRPQITTRAKSIDKSKQRGEHRTERLYQNFTTAKINYDAWKSKAETAIYSECTFAPDTTKSRSKSAKLPERAGGTDESLDQSTILTRQREFEERRKRKLDEALLRKSAQEIEEATFKPERVTKRYQSPALLTRKRSESNSVSISNVYERLTVPLQKDLSEVEKELNEKMPFKPQLATKRNISPKKYHGEYESVFDRLHKVGEQFQRDVEAERERLKQSTTPSFSPTLRFHRSASNDGHGDTISTAAVFDRLQSHANMRMEFEHGLKKLKEDVELQGCTFQPELIANSDKFLKQRTQVRIEDRLAREAQRVAQEKDRLRQEQLELDSQQTPLSPALPRKSIALANRRKSVVRVNSNETGHDEVSLAVSEVDSVFSKLYATKTAAMIIPETPKPMEDPDVIDGKRRKSVVLTPQDRERLHDRLNHTSTGKLREGTEYMDSYDTNDDARSVGSRSSMRSSLSSGSRFSRRSVVLQEEDLDKVFSRLSTTPIGRISESVNLNEVHKLALPPSQLNDTFNRLGSPDQEGSTAASRRRSVSTRRASVTTPGSAVKDDELSRSTADTRGVYKEGDRVASRRQSVQRLSNKKIVSSTNFVFGDVQSASRRGTAVTGPTDNAAGDNLDPRNTSLEIRLHSIYQNCYDNIGKYGDESDNNDAKNVNSQVQSSEKPSRTNSLDINSNMSVPQRLVGSNDGTTSPNQGMVRNPLTMSRSNSNMDQYQQQPSQAQSQPQTQQSPPPIVPMPPQSMKSTTIPPPPPAEIEIRGRNSAMTIDSDNDGISNLTSNPASPSQNQVPKKFFEALPNTNFVSLTMKGKDGNLSTLPPPPASPPKPSQKNVFASEPQQSRTKVVRSNSQDKPENVTPVLDVNNRLNKLANKLASQQASNNKQPVVAAKATTTAIKGSGSSDTCAADTSPRASSTIKGRPTGSRLNNTSTLTTPVTTVPLTTPDSATANNNSVRSNSAMRSRVVSSNRTATNNSSGQQPKPDTPTTRFAVVGFVADAAEAPKPRVRKTPSAMTGDVEEVEAAHNTYGVQWNNGSGSANSSLKGLFDDVDAPVMDYDDSHDDDGGALTSTMNTLSQSFSLPNSRQAGQRGQADLGFSESGSHKVKSVSSKSESFKAVRQAPNGSLYEI